MRRTSVSCLAALAAVGLILGANSGCSRSSPGNEEEATEQKSLAHVHKVAGETCFICDASKRESGRLWCAEHARYENRCWECQPQLEDKSRLFCEEHALYEDECFLCHPELREKGKEEATGAESSSGGVPPEKSTTAMGLFCNEHEVPEHECGICQPQRTAELEPGEELKVRFESTRSTSKAGLRTAFPEPTETRASVAALCEVQYNENQVARVTPLAPGIVRRVLVDVGTQVEAGEVLVELHSIEIAAARGDFVSAAVDAELKKLAFEREENLAARKVSSKKDLQEASAAYKKAALTLGTTRQRLLNFGLSEEEVARIEGTNDASATLLVRAPYAGTLVERTAVVGEAVAPGDALFTLADLSSMWLSLSVPADGAHLLQDGLSVEATLSGVSGPTVRGVLTWVNTSIDERSRMVRARAVVPNENRALRAGTFGEARVLLSAAGPVLSVPVGAVQHFEDNDYVFVKHEDDLYGLRRVVVARASNERFAVTAGLSPDEHVIVEGAFTAMSEFLKSRLGAGCVDD